MLDWLRQLDDLLRGNKTQPLLLAEARMGLSLRRFVPLAILLGAAYGFFMGGFAAINRQPPNYQQLLASTVKLPLLFLATLVVTFPSLYVFNALVGCRLSFATTLRLLVAAVVINLTVAASFGTILGFFTLCTTSYSFMIVLNVVLLAIAGGVGLGFLLHALRRLAWWQANGDASSRLPAANATEPGAVPSPPQITDVLGPANAVFRIWVIIYALVGAQMGWLLRPFIGSPSEPFEWFRERSGNFFLALSHAVQSLLNLPDGNGR